MTTDEIDIWRDTWLRYLGYANEVGESFRPLVHRRVVWAAYAVAVGYSLADTVDKSYKTYKKDGRIHAVLVDAGDAMIWQTLASVAIPGYVINRLCYCSREILRRCTKTRSVTRNWFAVAVGLASIPFIVKPIDQGTTMFMDATYRKLLKCI